MPQAETLKLIEDATFEYTLENNAEAIRLLEQATAMEPDCFEAWHALTEVFYSQKDYDKALEYAQKAYQLDPKDIHINTSLSRIWAEKGDKKQAEHYGAQVRILGWKEQLQSGDSD